MVLLFGRPNIEKLKANHDIEGLIKALSLKKADIRRAAVEVLVEIGDAQAVEALIKALKDDDKVVRMEAAETLGMIGDASSVEPLISAFKTEEDETVGKHILDALNNMRNIRTASSIASFIAALNRKDVREFAAKVLYDIGDSGAVEPLINALRDRKAVVREQAAEILGNIGSAHATEALINTLKDKDVNVRLSTVAALGKISDARTVEGLIGALKDEDTSVRENAAETLEKIGNAHAVERLIRALKDQDRNTRCSAVEILGKIGDTEAVEPLISMLKDEDKTVRQSAAKALGQIGDARAVESLTDMLIDANQEVCNSAVWAVERIEAVHRLISTLKNENEKVRERAANALGEIGSARAVKPLLDLLADEFRVCTKESDPFVGYYGIRPVPGLKTVINVYEFPVRSAAASALRKISNNPDVLREVKQTQLTFIEPISTPSDCYCDAH